MCENVIKVALEIPNWTHLLSYVTKAESTKEVEKNPKLATKLKCCAGLANLALRSCVSLPPLLFPMRGVLVERDSEEKSYVALYGKEQPGGLTRGGGY